MEILLNANVFLLCSIYLQALDNQLRIQLSKMLSLGAPKIYDMPIVQAIFEGNVIQLTELITQREEVNAIVSKMQYKKMAYL